MVTIVCYAISVYTIVLFIRIIWSWFRVPSSGPGRTIFEVIYDLTEPVLRPGPHRRHQTADQSEHRLGQIVDHLEDRAPRAGGRH
ncbi:MAG TPA: YggT family protein, partial [Actinomycetota bacterium]|nr:YggT family protein [Actinomycetota bacterium]